MILNSRQTVVMMIPKTAIEYIAMTVESLNGEMIVTGEPSCGGIPSKEFNEQQFQVVVTISLNYPHTQALAEWEKMSGILF